MTKENFQIITDRDAWDQHLCQLPHPHTLQTWDWGNFKSRWAWQPERLLWTDAQGHPQAAAQVLRRPLSKTPWSMLYVPKGPVWDYRDLALVEGVMHDLETYARQQRALFIKIDPDVILGFDPEAGQTYQPGLAVRDYLQSRGWRYSDQQIQFQNTVVIDLRPSEDDLLAAMKSKWRYNIRLAERRGVVIKPGGMDDLEDFYTLYALTSERDGFFIRPRAYYLDVWRQYLQADRAKLLLASVENELIAGLFLFHFGDIAWYMYGASSNEQRNLMPNHALQWRAMQAAKALGCRQYDMWGAPTVFDESDSMWGVYRFKLGFGGITRQSLGAYDFPVWPLGYRLYRYALPRLLRLVRKGMGVD